MATPSTVPATQVHIHPLQTLRSLTTELEAALTLVRADPDKNPVHKLRTTTRRIEAQLALLDILHGLPDHAAASEKLLRRLGKLRRAAGTVRDLDVHREILKRHAAASSLETKQPGKRASRKEKHQAEDASRFHAAKDLRNLLKHRRTVAADNLLQTLKRQGPKLVTRLEALLANLGDVDPVLTPAELQDSIRAWYSDRLATELRPKPSAVPPPSATAQPAATLHLPNPAPSAPHPNQLSADQLHTIRQVSKLARYLGESAAPAGQPDAAPPQPLADLATHFHALQQAGGDWHDALTLTKLARKDLGRRDPLTESLAQTRDRLLKTYQQHLSSFRP